jgi:hypothetical protein
MSNTEKTPKETSIDPNTPAEGKPLFDYKVGADHPGRHLPRKMPKPHRCNDHLEDLIQGIYHPPREILGPFKVWLKCVRSEEG